MLKTGKNAVGEYISRISCPEGPLFLSGALKSCIMSNFCHSFAVPPFARGRTASVVVLGASKRYDRPSRGGASVSLLGGELGKCGPPPLAWRRKRCGSSSAVASIMRLIRRRRRRVAHPQVRASGAHPGLQVLWFVPHWGISVAVALHVEGTSAVGPNPQVRASGAHPGLQVL